MLCSNIETGIGCIASSVPSLRHFFRRNKDGSSGPSNKRSGTGTQLVTVGGSRQQRRIRDSFRNPTDIGFSLSTVHHGRAEDNWERLDGDSDKSDAPIDPKRIYAERSYAVDIESDSEARKEGSVALEGNLCSYTTYQSIYRRSATLIISESKSQIRILVIRPSLPKLTVQY